MTTHFRTFELLALRSMASAALKDDVSDATSIFLEDFDDVLYMCGFVRQKSALCSILGLLKPQIKHSRRVLSDHAIFKLT